MTKKLILLVEDDQMIRDMFCEYIELDGVYDVLALENGHEAFQWLAHHSAPDIVLTDYTMPGRGDFLAQAVSRLGIPVIMITNNPVDAMKALKEMNLRIPIHPKLICFSRVLNLIDKMLGTQIKREEPA